jgi:O-antigen/teichoic acid export membrane protein
VNKRLPLKNLDVNMLEIVHKGSIAYGLKVLTAGLNFVFNVMIARLLGVEGSGSFFLALTIVTVASVVGRIGLDNTFVRFTASSVATSDWSTLKGLYQRGIVFALMTSGLITGLLMLLAPWLATNVFSDPTLTGPLRWMSLSVLPVALHTLYAQLLKGLKEIQNSMLVEKNGVLVQAISLLALFLLTPQLGAMGAVWSYVIATLTTLFAGFFLWHRATPFLEGVRGSFEQAELLQSSMPLFWSSILQLIILWSATFMLGAFASTREVGYFSVANRTVGLINFVLVAVNAISAPKFAELYKKGDMATLQKIAQGSAKLMTLMAGPLFLVCILAPTFVMRIFGEQFVPGATLLVIMAVGQFVNVITGSVGFLLNMTGHERLMRNTFIICAALSLALNALLIPSFGANGAATSSAVTLIAQNVIAFVYVWRYLHIWTLPIPRPRLRAK